MIWKVINLLSNMNLEKDGKIKSGKLEEKRDCKFDKNQGNRKQK